MKIPMSKTTYSSSKFSRTTQTSFCFSDVGADRIDNALLNSGAIKKIPVCMTGYSTAKTGNLNKFWKDRNKIFSGNSMYLSSATLGKQEDIFSN